jgi:hypothetical protein
MSNLHPIFEQILAPFAPREDDSDRCDTPPDLVEDLFVAGYSEQAQMLLDARAVLAQVVRAAENRENLSRETFDAAKRLIRRI